MIPDKNQIDILGCKVAAEIRTNGPGTPKQIAIALDLDEGYTLRKLIGMKHDGVLLGWTIRRDYCVFGFASW